MSLTNKLFSLLGFAEPVTLNRFNSKNLFPEQVFLLSISAQVDVYIQQAVTELKLDIIEYGDDILEKSVEALVIDATTYVDDSSYQKLYLSVQKSLKYLANNARILLITNAVSSKQSVEENAFVSALIGFTKSLAKEVGRKGSTANILFFDKEAIDQETNDNISAALASPLNFFLSAKSAFVSGQVLTISNKRKLVTQTPENLKNKKVAVVTGAAQGIGAAIASKLTGDDYFVIGVDIEAMKYLLVENMTKLQGESYILDVSSKLAGEHLTELAAQYNGIDLIVHNAGITRDKTLAKMPAHFWQQTIAINLLSVIAINKMLLSDNAINTNGSIVCLSSMNGIAGQGGQTNYACSKAGVIGYVNSMANELSARNITINAVAPGFIETKMTEQMPFFPREMGRRMSALGQGGLPVDVAETVAFLGKESSYAISGQTLRVCGLNIIGA